MADKNNVNIKIKADTEDAAKGINSFSKQLNKLSKDSKTTLSTFSKLGSIVSGAQAGLSVLAGAFSKVKDAVNDTIEAYKTQATAETLLETAVKNNPYLRDESVQNLKDYASHLQSIGTVGDETLIPMMAQLVAAGRSEQEIMDIMSTSLDVAASGSMSLESAVKNLSKTYSGLSGELGETLPQIKNLTAEQLKNGEAVKIVKDMYDGMAEKVTRQVGGAQQLKNAWGDFLEVLGKPINAVLNPIQIGFANFVSKITGMVSAIEDKWNSLKKLVSGESGKHAKPEINYIVNSDDIDKAQKKVDELKKKSDELKKAVAGAGKTSGDSARSAAEKILGTSSVYQQWNKNVEEGRKKQELLKKVLEQTGDEGKITAGIWKSLSKEEQAALSGEHIKKNSSASAIKSVLSQTETLISNSLKSMEEELSKTVNGGVKGAAESLVENLKSVDSELLDAQLDLQAKQEKLASQQKEAREKEEAEKKAAQDAELQRISEFGDKLAAQVELNAENQKRAIADGMQDEFDYSSYLSVISSSYQQLLTEAGTLAYDKSKKAAKAYIEKMIQLYKKTLSEQSGLSEEELARQNEIADEAVKDLSGGMKELAESIELPQEQLMELAQKIIDEAEVQLAFLDPQTKAYEKLADAIKNAKEAMEKFGETSEDAWGKMDTMQKAEWVIDQLSTLSQGVSDALSLMTETIENQASADLTELENLYNKGEISEEEYYEKKEKLEKESAQKKYKVELANWALNLLMTQSSAALAIAKCFEQGPVLGPISAAVMGVATAAQLAAQIAAKPVPPSFATGGIVQGTSYSGDNVQANVNSGEMILNAKQQRALWEAANGGASSGGTRFNIKIENSASDTVTSSVTPNTDGFTVAIKKIVSDAMADGELNDSYQTMRAGIYGRRITN